MEEVGGSGAWGWGVHERGDRTRTALLRNLVRWMLHTRRAINWRMTQATAQQKGRTLDKDPKVRKWWDQGWKFWPRPGGGNGAFGHQILGISIMSFCRCSWLNLLIPHSSVFRLWRYSFSPYSDLSHNAPSFPSVSHHVKDWSRCQHPRASSAVPVPCFCAHFHHWDLCDRE